jgi:hypothetical protein
MGRRSAITKLPLELQNSLDTRLRESTYGDFDVHAAWLESKGYTVSRSAIHRHSVALRAADSSLGDARARTATIKASPRRSRDDLLIELGRLHLAKERVIAQLLALDGSGIIPIDEGYDQSLNS